MRIWDLEPRIRELLVAEQDDRFVALDMVTAVVVSLIPVSMMTPVFAKGRPSDVSPFSRLQISQPLMPGIITSRRMRSGDCARAVTSASGSAFAWRQSRYDKAGPGGTGADYINCPLEKPEYEAFIAALSSDDWRVQAYAALRQAVRAGAGIGIDDRAQRNAGRALGFEEDAAINEGRPGPETSGRSEGSGGPDMIRLGAGIDCQKGRYAQGIKALEDLLSRNRILSNVWEHNSETYTNVVDVYVRYLRNKLGAERFDRGKAHAVIRCPDAADLVAELGLEPDQGEEHRRTDACDDAEGEDGPDHCPESRPAHLDSVG